MYRILRARNTYGFIYFQGTKEIIGTGQTHESNWALWI